MFEEKYAEKLIEENNNLKYAISHMSKQLAKMSSALREIDLENVDEEYTKEYFWMAFANSLAKDSLKKELLDMQDCLSD